MAFYEMRCRQCGFECEVYRSIMDGPPSHCEQCNATEEEGFTQKWERKRVDGRTYGEDHITTVGQQAEHNAKKAGKELTQKMWENSRTKKEGESVWSQIPGAKPGKPMEAATPWWRDGSVEGLPKKDKPIDLKKVDTPEKQEKYIMEGRA